MLDVSEYVEGVNKLISGTAVISIKVFTELTKANALKFLHDISYKLCQAHKKIYENYSILNRTSYFIVIITVNIINSI